MGRKSAGRPTKQNKETVLKLEQAFAIDASVEEACFYAGIARNTFYEWMKANPALKDRLEDLRAKPVLQARQTIVSALNDPVHARWFLEKKKKKEFGAAIDITSDGRAIGPTPEAQQLSDTAIDRFLNGTGKNNQTNNS